MKHNFYTLIKQKLNLTKLLFIFTTAIASQQVAGADWSAAEETISSGNRTYDRFCSVCHAANGKGNGPFTKNLIVTPPNLTTLSANNGGVFPWMQIYEVIDGDEKMRAHGSSEMPIWGEAFDLRNWGKGYNEYADVIVRGRIFELLVYLNYIQE